MGSEWREVTLGELIQVKHGWPFKSEEFSIERKGRPIVVSIGNFQYSGGFRFESTSIKEYEGDYPRQYELSPGDILLIMTCQTAGGEILGIPARVPSDGNIYLHNQRLGLVTLQNSNAELNFLYWLFLSPEFNRHLFLTATGTKILHTAPSRIESFRFFLPPLSEQKAIAHILGSLDDKIELNRKQNATLEAMAQALFQSWFVDFDPVIDKALAAGNEIPEPLQSRAARRAALGNRRKPLPADIADLFPDRFVETEEMGWVPEGWGVGRLDDMVVLQRGFDLPKTTRDNGTVPLIASSGQDGFHSEAKVSGPGIVTGRSGKIGVVTFVQHDFWPLNTTLWVKTFGRSNPYHAYYLLQRIDLAGFSTGSAVPTLNRNHVHGLPMPLPPMKLIDEFGRIGKALFDKKYSNEENTKQTNSIRDTLLPKLISGEIRIGDVENLIS